MQDLTALLPLTPLLPGELLVGIVGLIHMAGGLWAAWQLAKTLQLLAFKAIRLCLEARLSVLPCMGLDKTQRIAASRSLLRIADFPGDEKSFFTAIGSC